MVITIESMILHLNRQQDIQLIQLIKAIVVTYEYNLYWFMDQHKIVHPSVHTAI